MLRAWATVWGLLLALAGPAAGQQSCSYQAGGNQYVSNPGTPNELQYLGGGVVLNCEAGTRIRSDSVMITRAGGYADFIGNVSFTDTAKTLTAATARYYTRNRHLAAQGGSGRVVLTDLATGSLIVSPTLDYFQDDDRIQIYSGRPVATLFRTPADQRQPGDTTEVVADAMTIRGQQIFEGEGNVVIERADVVATAQRRAFFDEGGGILRLVGGARMEGDYTLTGDSILAYTERAPAVADSQGGADRRLPGRLPPPPDTALLVADTAGLDLARPPVDDPDAAPADPNDFREIVALGTATLTSAEMTAEGARIRVLFAAGEVERLVVLAPGPEEGVAAPAPPGETGARPRAVARSATFTMEADSIDALAPGQVVDQVLAVGTARGVMRDTVAADLEGVPEIARDNWIEGDTIRAFFAASERVASAGPSDEPDTVAALLEAPPRGERVLERLVATGGPARALFRQRAEDDTERPWDLSYLLARHIVVQMDNGEVSGVQAEGDVTGIQLTPEGGARRAGGRAP